jgi:nicotinate-nucleotide adenylyltransferase
VLFGGAFDPPHNGHVALARAAKERFGVDRLVILVSERPGHKTVRTPAEVRLRLARAAFPEDEVRVDPHARTIDLLRAGEWEQPLLLLGADQFVDFSTWKEPDAVLELARLAVGTRPGFARERLDAALSRLPRPERVVLFEFDPVPVASREVRDHAARGEPLDRLVPPAVADLIASERLYEEGPARSRARHGRR